ncbi:MAG: hypothetical protein HZB20_05845 [Chloroflexi bacterium]|nr:hypothetical protein [Chloroflexota bacterium]
MTKPLFWLTPPLVAFGLYHSTVSLPFFWDDVANFQFMFGRSLAQMWVDSSGFPYYRPLTFGLWRALQLAFGPTNPLPFHALNLLALVANGWLVGLLTKRLAADSNDADLIGWLAGALMTAFPFAALVAPLVASLFHLLVTLITVAACLCLLEYDRTRRPAWAVAAVALAALAPFTHESGLAAAALMGVCVFANRPIITIDSNKRLNDKFYIWHLTREAGIRHLIRPLALALLLNLAFIPWWAHVPKARPEGSFAWVGWESLGQSAVFFLEGLTFPIQFLARPLMALGMVDLWAVLALGLATLAVAALALRNRRWLWLGVAYCFIAALPALAALPFSYIIVSPRLMVFTAPAAAMLWAAVMVEASGRVTEKKRRGWLAAAAVVIVSIVPARHIQREVHWHHVALDHLRAFVADAQAHPAERLLVVNAVNWIAPTRATYALGHEGVEVMPGYLNLQLIAWAHTQRLYPVEGVAFPLVFRQLNELYFSAWGEALDWEAMAQRVRQADQVAVVRYADDGLSYQPVGRVVAAAGEALISFEDRIWLTSYRAEPTARAIDLYLNWRVNAASGEDIYAHASDCNGKLLGQMDGAGMGGIYPIWLWRPGESIEEVRRVELTTPSPGGCYQIGLGLFDPKTGRRTAAFDAAGRRLDNDEVVIQLPVH